MSQTTSYNPFEFINNELAEIKDRLSELVEPKSTTPQIVDEAFLAKEIKVTRQTIGRWRIQGRIPFIQVGSVIRYDFLKVIEALEEGSV